MMTAPGRGHRGSIRPGALILMVALFVVGAIGGALLFSTGRKNVPFGERSSASPAATRASSPAAESSTAPGVTEGSRAAGNDGATPASSRSEIERDAAQLDILTTRSNAIVAASQRAGSAVVTVGVTKTRYVRGRRPMADPFDLFFYRYLPDVVYQENITGMGSGFIVDRSGIVLTNEHVVRGADEIQIILSDGRTLKARILGADESYDLAVLKVDGDDLPVADLGTSDDLVVGEWAIAIGNPFGFYLNDHQPTVTVGVISAIHRDVKSD